MISHAHPAVTAVTAAMLSHIVMRHAKQRGQLLSCRKLKVYTDVQRASRQLCIECRYRKAVERKVHANFTRGHHPIEALIWARVLTVLQTYRTDGSSTYPSLDTAWDNIQQILHERI